MTNTTSKYRILETNVLLERFATYSEVFTEYFKTMKVIERGEALRYETYSRLTDNYISNIHRFIKLCNSYVIKYHLEDSVMADKLNNYFIDLIDALNCLDVDNEVVDHLSWSQSQIKIKQAQDEFMGTINFFIK